MVITASAISGNPKTPCSGSGFCEVQYTGINSELAFTVELSSPHGQDLNIHVGSEALRQLSATRPDIHTSLMSQRFSFDQGALPFHLDLVVSQNLWPAMAGYSRLDDGTCTVSYNDVDYTVDILFPNVTHNTPGTHYGTPGSIDGPSLKSGKWEIGQDGYGNLVFVNTDGGNLVVFGEMGNIGVQRYSVKHSSDQLGFQMLPPDPTPLVGNWKYCIDENYCLVFTNGINNVTFADSQRNIYLSGRGLEKIYVGERVANTTLAENVDRFELQKDNQKWIMCEDIYGNLCFTGPSSTSYFFGKYKDIIVGYEDAVVTSYPYGS